MNETMEVEVFEKSNQQSKVLYPTSKFDPIEYVNVLTIRDGLSVSDAIRKYTNMFGLLENKDKTKLSNKQEKL